MLSFAVAPPSHASTTLLVNPVGYFHSSLKRGRVAAMIISAAAAAVLAGCRTSPRVVERHGLLTFVCDTASMPPLRAAEIPGVPVVAGYGSLTGMVFREGTGTGIIGSIFLSPQDSAKSYRRRETGAAGGFAFDSVVPGRYRLRVAAVWEHPEELVCYSRRQPRRYCAPSNASAGVLQSLLTVR